MKVLKTAVMTALILSVSFTQTSCIGSFSLFNKLLDWNQNVGGKFANAGVFFVLWIIPVYEIVIVIDVLILNTIEFWSGSNPTAMEPGEKEVEYVKGKDGNLYKITATQNRFDIEQLNDESKVQSLVFTPDTKTWSYEDADKKIDLLSINDDETLTVYSPEGDELVYTANEMANMDKAGFQSSFLVKSALAVKE